LQASLASKLEIPNPKSEGKRQTSNCQPSKPDAASPFGHFCFEIVSFLGISDFEFRVSSLEHGCPGTAGSVGAGPVMQTHLKLKPYCGKAFQVSSSAWEAQNLKPET
jgi:hypothetical protein